MHRSTYKTSIASLLIAIFILGLGYLVYVMIYAPEVGSPVVPSFGTSTGSPADIRNGSSTGDLSGSSTVGAEGKGIKATYVNASSSTIIVDLPFPGAVVGKDFSVIGKVRAGWFFEASFPIEILDKSGKHLAFGVAKAQGDWMQEGFVPFKADIKIPSSYIGSATIVLKKDNPSGMPEHDGSVSFPVTVEY